MIEGRVATGRGLGRQFTQLDWARRQFIAALGIDPYPGTLNVIVEDAHGLAVWRRLQATPGIAIENPGDGPHDCDARCYLVAVAGIDAAIVLPEVASYPPGQIELIAAVGLREALALRDGAVVRLVLR